MLILKLVIVTSALVGILKGFNWFNNHCYRKFGHAFFTRQAFWRAAVGFNLMMFGAYWYDAAARQHGDTLNGLVLIAVGFAIAIWLVYLNFRNTNLLYGIGGSAIQMWLFWSLAWIGIPVLIVFMFCQFMMLMDTRPVYIVNH
ncbi:hypothetical protein M0D69_14530 [Caballeronia sp. SEWSISQ10-4 2]|jgi:hypothetical protein|uniref:hypothetical protein n=1 Tax=Caballeronia sp. SEWSISQ10-4 2 TaxID=2937438 RepID=UPI002651DAB5|nr:hypothetical protein [Caballeronia sp. SEWSISQ10-4 2]MDN7179202.1 hypothetical protein [Caballeronia sp. SEWSISQ10-4 2]